MNSLLIIFLSTILFFSGFIFCTPNNEYDQVIDQTPHNFNYYWNDVLKMNIYLINRPPIVTKIYIYIIYYETDGVKMSTQTIYPDEKDFSYKIDIILVGTNFSIEMDLCQYNYDSDSWLCWLNSHFCTITTTRNVKIAHGVMLTGLRPNDRKDTCIKENICSIVVDYKERYEQKPTEPYFNCIKIDLVYICTLETTNLVLHTWRQSYDKKSPIGYMSKYYSYVTKFLVQLEHFDNNTFIEALLESGYFSQKIVLENNFINAEKNMSSIMFTDTTFVPFDCEEYSNQGKNVGVFIGIINTTENKIDTIHTSQMTKKYDKSYNGCILCCIYYNTSTAPGTRATNYMYRFIHNKTLLIYYENYISANTSPKNAELNNKELNNKDLNNNSTALNSDEKPSQFQNRELIYITSVVGIVILVLIILVTVKKKYFRKKPARPVETMELNTYCTTEQVLYADLDVETSRDRPLNQNEDSAYYAEIIGVLEPKDKRTVGYSKK